jgi:hypothetical protein
MLAILLSLFRFLRLLASGYQALAIENLALRRQLAAYRRKHTRPRLTRFDRWFWAGISYLWRDWRLALVFVHPETAPAAATLSTLLGQIVQSERSTRQARNCAGAPAADCSDRYGKSPRRAPRIDCELKMLGIIISERTVSRVPCTIPRPRSQSWKTVLKNHLGEIVSVDFFTVPTIRLQVLFVFIVIEHHRREILHCNITDHPTSAWVAQQMVEAFGNRAAPR